MISMGHRLVSAIRAMPVILVMPLTSVLRRTARWICSRYFQRVFIEMAFMGRMKMPVMEIVRVAIVPNGLMAATRPVSMAVRFMCLVFQGTHDDLLKDDAA